MKMKPQEGALKTEPKKDQDESKHPVPDAVILQKMKAAFKELDVSLEDVLAGKLDFLDQKSDQADEIASD